MHAVCYEWLAGVTVRSRDVRGNGIPMNGIPNGNGNPTHKIPAVVHWSALISVSLLILSPQPGTSLHCKTAVSLFAPRLSLVVISRAHEGMARLSLLGIVSYISTSFTRLRVGTAV